MASEKVIQSFSVCKERRRREKVALKKEIFEMS